MDFNLDFTIETSNDRRDFIASKDLSKLNKKEIELCSNYILYGKDPNKDMTSCVDRKEIQIKTKFSSYSKKEPVSLDALLESPTFNENLLKPKPTIYKKVKPTIDKEKAKDIPGMRELWEQIEEAQKNYKKQIEEMKAYILERTEIDEKTFNKNKNKDWYLTSDELLKYKVIDDVITDLSVII